jgi:hypothetical protein
MSRHAQLMKMLLPALISWLAAGCQSSPSLVKADAVKPVTPMELKAGTDGVELTVAGLIYYNSPGSWMKRAYWDEYVVRLDNHRPEAVMIDTIVLGDVLDRTVAPGGDPWAMETTGIIHERYLYNLLAPAKAGKCARLRPPAASSDSKAPGDTSAVSVAGIAGVAGYLALTTSPVAAGAVFWGAPVVIVAATPVVLVDQVFFAPKNRQLVLNEFNRRRLTWPIRLEPGASMTGSVFFPLTPGPEKLSVRGRAGEGALEVTLGLTGLEGLHFTYVPDKAALKTATTRRYFDLELIPERNGPVVVPFQRRNGLRFGHRTPADEITKSP